MREPGRWLTGAGLLATALLGVLLTGCGAGAGAVASATATATCPPTPTFKVVSGHITAASSGSITVTDTSGTATAVAISSTTRVTQIQPLTAASLKAGTAVLVLTDTNATVAQRINVLPAGVSATGTPGAGGFGGFGGRGSGTPSAGRNRACFQRSGQGGGFAGQTGTGGAFQGLRGTIDSATSTRLIFDDAQGQTYSVAITSATTIQQTAQAQLSNLVVGKSVAVTAIAATGGLTARAIVIQA